MTTSATIQELARQVRRDTLGILLAAEPNWLTYAPPGTSNHILWHAGHALWIVEVLGIEMLGGSSELPAGWPETFGMHCRPPHQTTTWPSRSELAELLQRQLEHLLNLLSLVSDEQLAQPANLSRGPAPVSARIIHALHDEAKHSGEMYLLLKLCRANTDT
jgi:putative hemolysin